MRISYVNTVFTCPPLYPISAPVPSTPQTLDFFLNYYFHNMQYAYINTTLCRLMSLICFCINTDNLDGLTYQGYCTYRRLNHQQPLVASTSSSRDRALWDPHLPHWYVSPCGYCAGLVWLMVLRFHRCSFSLVSTRQQPLADILIFLFWSVNLISLNYKNPESVFRVRPERSEKESSQSPETSRNKGVSLSSAGLKGVHHRHLALFLF